MAEAHAVRQAVAAAGADADIFGVGTMALAKTDRQHLHAAAAAETKIDARRMLAAADHGKTRDPVAGLPQMRDGFADLHHLARKLMAHHRAARQGHDRSGLRHMQV